MKFPSASHPHRNVFHRSDNGDTGQSDASLNKTARINGSVPNRETPHNIVVTSVSKACD